MSTAAAIMFAAVVLACPLHMLWRVRQGRRACCAPARRCAAAELRERQRALAEGVDALVDFRVRRDSAAGRH